MPTNPFDELNELAPSQNYSQKNPFDDLFEQENKEKEEKLKQILHTVSTLDPDKTGEAQKLAERLNLPPGVALNSDETINILSSDKRNKMLITHYQFMASILPSYVYSPSKTYTMDGISYPLKGNKYHYDYA